MISPHGPDPVFFGVRGENPSVLISAAELIKPQEKLDGYMAEVVFIDGAALTPSSFGEFD